MHRPRNHRKPKNHRMQQPENVVCTNPEQHRTTTQKTQTDQPKKKTKTQNISTENTNKPTQKTQTHNRKYSIGDKPTQKK